MIKSKLIAIFQSFDKTEKSGLRKWALSPVHNQHKDVLKVIDYLLSRRKITKTSVKRERVYTHLYPELAYDMYRLNHVFSFTVEMMEAYIRFLMSKNNVEDGHFLVNVYYQNRNLPHLAKKTLKKTQEVLMKATLKDEVYYHRRFTLEQAWFDLEGTEQRQQSTNLQDIFSNLATFTIISTLRNACIALSHKNLFHIDYQIPLLESILEEATAPVYADNLVVQSYYHSYMALRNPEDETHFISLKNILLQKHVPLKAEALKQLCLLAINYCIKRLNRGAEKYVQEVFDIYNFGLEHQIWLENGFLSHNTFKNIATAALRLKAYEWTDGFIRTYGPQIKVSHQKDYTNYIRAKLLFEQGAYGQAQSLLMETEVIDLFIGLGIKILLLKIYWQLKAYSLLEAHLDSFTVYLNRKKVFSHRQFYSNIILITRKIVHADLHNTKEKERLMKLIMETNPLTERPWLLKQLDLK